MLKQFTPFQKKIILLGIIVQVITAWFSEGYNNADEHWQILEFANYKLGIFSQRSLPWEFREEIRSAFIPGIVFLFRKFLFLFHIVNPFITAFLLRLVISFFSFTCALLLLNYSLRYLKNEAARNLAVALSFLLWFMPYLHCRFSSETIGAVLFFFGFLAVAPSPGKENKSSWFFLLAGLLFGLSFLSRFQMAFAVAGLILWLLFIQKIKWKHFALLVVGGCVALLAGIAVDYWYYGHFVITVYNYYQTNIVRGVASQFGVMPFWFYITSFVTDSVPPIGVLLFAGIILSLYYFPKHPFAWITVAFLLAHSITPHKEIRFLFPLIYVLPLLTVLWMEKTNWNGRLFNNLVFKSLYYISIGINLILLLVLTVLPAKETVPMYRAIYKEAQKKDVVIYSLNSNLYNYDDSITDKFYQSPNVKVVVVKSISSVQPDSIKSDDKEYFVADNHFSLDRNNADTTLSYVCAKRTIPKWLSKFNFNNWQSRANAWCLYRVIKAGNN